MTTTRTIAALYVEHGGTYYGLDGVEPWGLPERDARRYDGPHPVVAHPPCERWGPFWSGGPMAHKVGNQRRMGDDDGCFREAIRAVRAFGGVIEHPKGSKAWDVYGVRKPTKDMGWIQADEWGGHTCYVEQGAYGHRAKKPTWLYVCGVPRSALPELTWSAPGHRIWFGGDGYRTAEERAWMREQGVVGNGKYMPKRERAATPVQFRDLLIALARSVGG